MANTHFGIKISKPLEVDTSPKKPSSAKLVDPPPPPQTVPEPETTPPPSQTTQDVVVPSSGNVSSATEEKKPVVTQKALTIPKDPGIPGLPFKKGDKSIKPNDTGPAVKWIQDFLQTLPYIQKEQSLLADMGRGFSLTDSKHYGSYELDSRKAMRDYHKFNKSRIKKAGNLTDDEIDNEINASIISFATVLVILEDKGEVTVVQPEAKVDPPVEKTQSAIEDPPLAASVPESRFFVKTKNPSHRLALREAPAYSKVSKEADEDEDRKGKRAVAEPNMMKNDTLLKVITPHVGYNCEWHQVEVVDPSPIWNEIKEYQKTHKLFSYAEFVQPLKDTPPLFPVNCMDSTEVVEGGERKTPFPDWTGLGECDIFYDAETNKYYIVYESAAELIQSPIFEKQLAEQRRIAQFDGIRLLLEFYDKQNNKDLIDRLINAFGSSIEDNKDIFFDDRPSARPKFLVGVSGKYFDAIPRSSEYLKGIPTLGGIMPKEWRSTVLSYGDLKSGIDVIVGRFEEYALEIEKWDGQVLNLDLREEGSKLKAFLPVFDKFLKWNSVIPKDESVFEIGFGGPCFRTLYVLEKSFLSITEKQDVMIPLRIGIECFKNTEPVNLERTMGYIFYLNEMVKDIKREKRRWISFVNSYTCPIARIIPSAKKRGEDTKARANASPVKNDTEKEKEDKKIQEVKANLIASRPPWDFVGDPLLSCENISSVIDSVRDLDDLYKNILNKINVSDVVSFVTSCITAGLSPADISNMACQSALNSLGYDQLQKVLDFMDNNELFAAQDRMVQMSSDPQYANTEPSMRLRIAINGTVSKESICKAISRFDPSLIADFVKRMLPGKREKWRPQVPTINFKDSLPTEDTLRGIREAIENSVKEAIFKTLLMLVKMLLMSLCNICSARALPPQQEPYGEKKFKDFFKGKNPNEIDLGDFDIPSDAFEDIDIEDFFDDLFSILTLRELCALLSGEPSQQVLNVIKNLIKAKYPSLYVYIHDTYKIKQIFKHLGKFIDPALCAEMDNRFGSVAENLCEPVEDLRRALLQEKLPEDLLNKQLEEEKERKKEILRQLVNLTNDNALNGFLPPLTKDACNKSGINTPAINSIIPHDPPSVQKLNDDVIDVMFKGLDGKFNDDVRGFIDSFVEAESEKFSYDSESIKSLYDIIRKMAGDLRVDEQYALLKDPDLSGGGKGSPIVAVMPGLRKSLSNKNNFVSVKNFPTIYDFKSDLEKDKINKFLADAAKRKEENLARLEEEKSKPQMTQKVGGTTAVRVKAPPAPVGAPKSVPGVPGGGNYGQAQEASYSSLAEICIEDIPEKSLYAPVDDPDMSPNTLVRYYVREYNGDRANLKDAFRFRFNDIASGESIEFSESVPISKEVESFIREYDAERNLSAQQDFFAKFIKSKWTQVLTSDSAASIQNNAEFDEYLKRNAYSEIMTNIMKNMSRQISDSRLFNKEVFSGIDFIPDPELSSEECQEFVQKSLLSIDEIKEKTKDKYEKETDKCKDKLDDYLSKMDPMERAGLSSSVGLYVKVFVIENFLKGMFVFSNFKIDDLFGDGIIVKFLTYKIQSEIKKHSGSFYSIILKECQNIVKSRGPSITDPFSKNKGFDTDKKVADESDVNWVLGEKGLEFIIKENMKEFSEVFDETLGLPKETSVFHTLLNAWFPMENVLTAEEIIKNVLTKNDPFGNFLFEKYKRVCDDKNGEVVRIDKPSAKDTKVLYGIRLSYVPSLSVNFKESVFGLTVPKETVLNEKTYILEEKKETKVKIGEKKTNDPDNKTGIKSIYNTFHNKCCVMPIITVEEEDFHAESPDNIKQNTIVDLKTKMISTPEFQTMFTYFFPVQRILSLFTVYNILSVSAMIKNPDYKFSSSKKMLRNLINILLPSEDQWWKRKLLGDNMEGNDELRERYMQNYSTQGPSPDHAAIAAMTVPILAKGMAERYDPCYGLMKKIWDVNPDALMGGLGWGSVIQMLPINIIPLIGFGPPLLSWGMIALSTDLLPGERNHQRKNSQKEKDRRKDKCKGGKK